MNGPAAMLIALALDAAVGWPGWLYARIGHPVGWIGALIATLDRRWNRDTASAGRRRAAGLAAALLTIALAAAVAGLVQAALHSALPGGAAPVLIAGLLAWPLVAARSLHDHVAAVARPLDLGDTEGARHAVSMIVGRDPAQLDPPAIARAGIESLAENASDGVVAPLVWGALFGLPGIAAYKAINTLDSMIGHRSPRHEAFGWAAARIDDVANLIPARLTALLFLAVGAADRAGPAGGRRTALRVVLRDARRHRSPNAGWPEAAMAGLLGIRLSGPRIYGDRIAAEPWLNPGAPDPGAGRMAAALALFRRATALCGAGLMAAGLLLAAAG